MSASTPAAVLPPQRAPLAAPRFDAPPAWLALLWIGALAATLAYATVVGIEPTVIGVLTGLVFLLAGRSVVAMAVRVERRFLLRLFVGAFLARYIATLFVAGAVALAGLPGLQGGKDYLAWEAGGWAVAEAWRSGGDLLVLTDQDPGYYYLIGAVYVITGRVPVAPTLLNALFGAGAAVLTFLITKKLYDRRTAVIAGYLAAFLPTLLFWSSLLYKDIILSFFVTATVAAALEVYAQPSRRWVLVLGGSLLPLFMIRPQAGMTLIAATALLMTLTGRRRVLKLLVLALAGGVLFALLLVLQKAGLGGKLQLAAKFQNPLDAVLLAREGWADKVGEQVTGFTRFLYGRDLTRAPHLLLLAMALPFFLPLPKLGSLGMNFSTFLLPGQLVWLMLLPALLVGAAQAVRDWVVPRVFVVGVVVLLVTGVALAGYFSNPRYLIQGVPLMLALIASGVLGLRRHVLGYLAMILGVVVLLCVYGLMKGL